MTSRVKNIELPRHGTSELSREIARESHIAVTHHTLERIDRIILDRLGMDNVNRYVDDMRRLLEHAWAENATWRKRQTVDEIVTALLRENVIAQVDSDETAEVIEKVLVRTVRLDGGAAEREGRGDGALFEWLLF